MPITKPVNLHDDVFFNLTTHESLIYGYNMKAASTIYYFSIGKPWDASGNKCSYDDYNDIVYDRYAKLKYHKKSMKPISFNWS